MLNGECGTEKGKWQINKKYNDEDLGITWKIPWKAVSSQLSQ